MKLLEQLIDIVGARQVLTGAEATSYGIDSTKIYTATPLCVVRPANTAEVSAIMALAYETGTPVVPIGGNTGLVGGTFAPDSLMLSLERMNTIREIRRDARVAIVEAGVVLSKLHDAADAEDLVFPLTFGARGSAMIGGNLATNAGGSNVVRYGSTRGLCMGIEVVLPDGQIMDLMTELHKDNSGFDLKDLYIGAEGTLGIITAAVVKLVPKPGAYATAMVSAKSISSALEMLNRLQEASGGMVEAFELMPKTYIKRLGLIRPDLTPPLGDEVENTILVELGATAPRDTKALEDGSIPVVNLLEDTLVELIEEGLALDASIAQSETQRRNMWSMREAAAEITLGRRPIVNTDVAVPLDKVESFLEQATERAEQLDPGADTFTVCHLGDGNLHFSVWPTKDDDALNDALREMVEDVTLELGGSFSAEHGIGLSKLNSMARRKDAVALNVMRQIKAAIDPKGIMNPGKVLP